MASIIANNIINSSSEISYNYNETEEIFGYNITANYTLNVADVAFENGDGFLIAGRNAVTQAYAKPEIVARIGGDRINIIFSRIFSWIRKCIYYDSRINEIG